MSNAMQRASTGCLLLVGVWVTLLQVTSFGQTTGIKPGLWEMEQIFEIPGGPPEGFKNQWQHCVTEEDAKQGPVFSESDRQALSDAAKGKGKSKAAECKVENLRYPEPGYVVYDVVCGTRENRIRVEYRYTETTFEGTTRPVGGKKAMTFTMRGRYIGPCKK